MSPTIHRNQFEIYRSSHESNWNDSEVSILLDVTDGTRRKMERIVLDRG